MNHGPGKALKQEKRVVLCVGLAAFIFQFEAFAVSIALPTMARDFQVTSTSISLVILAFMLAATATFLPAGRLGGRFGLTRTFLAGCGVAMLGTLGCGLSQSFSALAVFRFIQGMGVGVLASLGYVMIPAWVHQDRSGWGFGHLNMAAGVGMLAGVPFGGLLVSLANWRWIFFSNVPLLALLMILARRYLPWGPGDASRAKRLDWPGAVLLATALMTSLSGLSFGKKMGWQSPMILACFAVSAVSILALWRRLATCRFPLIAPELFSHPRFIASLGVLFLVRAVLGGALFLMPFYLEICCGLSALASSIVLLFYPAAYAPMGPRAGRLADRVGSRPLVLGATLAGSVACLVFALVLGFAGLGTALFFLVIMGCSMGMFFSPNNRFSIQSAPDGQKSEAAMLIPVALNMGTAFGVSFFETIFSMGLPRGAGPLKHSAAWATGLPLAGVSRGFSEAFLAAGAVLFIAAAISLLGYGTPRKGHTR